MALCMGDVETDRRQAPFPDDRAGAQNAGDDFGDRVYRLALRITGVKDEAEGAVDEALQMAATTTQAFSGASALESWLYLRVACAAHQRLRRRRSHGVPVVLDDLLPPLDGDERHFEEMDDWSDRIGKHALQGKLRGTVTAALDALPADYRTALVLHDVEGVSKPDIADVLGMDVSAVKSHVHRARLFVRKRLSEYFALAGAA
jgi:RNA polymerase sigma-70 factor (ECF subfamily)